MKRREFIASLIAAATTQVAVAEEPTKTYRLAIARAFCEKVESRRDWTEPPSSATGVKVSQTSSLF